jgi:hypothetical protein
MKIEFNELAGYLPHELQIAYFFFGEHICTAPMVASMIGNSFTKEIPINAILTNDADFKPLLHPLSDLTKEIDHNGERFVPVEWFEIGDDGGESLEYTHGNIKLIKTLKFIAEYNIHNDINYLPYGVVQKLHEWHFDVFNWIEKGLAIDKNTLPHA